MMHWDKYVDSLYSLIVVFGFDEKLPLVKMQTQNYWSIRQQLYENQKSIERQKLSSFKVLKIRTKKEWKWFQWNGMIKKCDVR